MPKTASRIGTGGSARFTTNIIARPIVASGGDVVTPLHRYPVEPPSDWFTKRQYSAPTPVVCTKAGQLFGHIWDWTKPHIGANGVRLLPPRNFSNYSEFQNKRVLCEDGQHVATGPVYIDIDHAPLGLTGPQAREWMSEMAGAIDGMNNTRCAVADVSIFDDEWGGQIAGALRPTCSPLSRRVFEGSDISPDWRASQTSRHQHEMYGLVSVNTSGLPVTQWDTSAIVASGGPVRRARRVTPGQVAYRLEEDGAVGTIVAVGMVRHDPDAGARRDELAELRSRVARHDALLANMAADAIMLDMEADAVMATLPPLA